MKRSAIMADMLVWQSTEAELLCEDCVCETTTLYRVEWWTGEYAMHDYVDVCADCWQGRVLLRELSQ